LTQIYDKVFEITNKKVEKMHFLLKKSVLRAFLCAKKGIFRKFAPENGCLPLF